MSDTSIAGRVSRRAAALVAGLGLMAAGSVAVSGPASAATGPCGIAATARKTIHYKACFERVGPHSYMGHFLFSNDHGSEVAVWSRVGLVVNGDYIWNGSGSSRTLRAEPGFVERKTTDPGNCVQGRDIHQAIVQVRENDGSWGDIAYSPSRSCE